jgi:4-hydroxy-tetrahydrodipicolinate synthase
MLKEGAVGAISVVGNVIPRIWKKMIDLARSNQWDASHLLAARFLPLCESLFRETNPQCVKFALSLLGKCKAVLRLPLVEPTVEVQEEISNVLNELALRGRRLRGENAAQGFVLSRPKSV